MNASPPTDIRRLPRPNPRPELDTPPAIKSYRKLSNILPVRPKSIQRPANILHNILFLLLPIRSNDIYLFISCSHAHFILNSKYECTMDQKLTDAAAYTPGRRCVCTHQVAALFVLMTSQPPSWKYDVTRRKSKSVNPCNV